MSRSPSGSSLCHFPALQDKAEEEAPSSSSAAAAKPWEKRDQSRANGAQGTQKLSKVPASPSSQGWNKAVPLPGAVAAGPDVPRSDISGAGHDPGVCQRCLGRHPEPEPLPAVSEWADSCGWAALASTGHRGGCPRAELRAIVRLPRRWNPRAQSPSCVSATATAPGVTRPEKKEETHNSLESPLPPSPSNDLGFLPRKRQKHPLGQKKVSQEKPRVLW